MVGKGGGETVCMQGIQEPWRKSGRGQVGGVPFCALPQAAPCLELALNIGLNKAGIFQGGQVQVIVQSQ